MGEKGSVQGLWVVRIPIYFFRGGSFANPPFFVYLYIAMRILFSLFVFTLLFGCVNAQPINVMVGKIQNGIKIGPMVGNKNLTLGLKNIAEEAIPVLGV